MKTYGKLILTLFFAILLEAGFAQNFLASELKPDKKYVLLAHPTVQNIETIQFLLNNDILKLSDVEFVGVYSSAENYDYSQSVSLIQKSGMNRFHLQKLDGEEDPAHIYRPNGWSITFRNLFEHSAGIFFFGGPDIQPEIYGQKNLYSVVTDPNRHLFELSFLFHLLGDKQNEEFVPFLNEKPNYFVSGFCLGMQSMNVATGGTLNQDIPAQTYQKLNAEETLKLKKEQLHRNYWPGMIKDTLFMRINFHPIEYTAHPFFLKKVKVKKIMNPLVLSSHHQSIDELGKDLIVTATSMNGEVIEGIQHRVYPNVFAVQFHPEVPALYKEGKKLKFAPEDTPASYYEIIGEEGREFHRKYWITISKAIKSSIKSQKRK
ncbi:MAG TPA: gamma-glutamyl-gamma-aminobutyrate hydrolase family protein [Prolixibacteraceae bacterium]|nr:gamma-glutamyl-gamma-aminobutyrate hydrolase family protein [Prolixibacteraceae bacterium]